MNKFTGILPLLKTKSKTTRSSYRPIANLFFLEVNRRANKHQLSDYFKIINLVLKFRHEGRKSWSRVPARATIDTECSQIIELGFVLSTDLLSGFDKIDMSILMNKLRA